MNTVQLKLRFGSVCSGIEAVSLAWLPLGLSAAWFSEINPFANAVLAHHYPHVRNLGDMTGVAPLIQSGALCAPEILVGGPPCQSFSIAGMRRGLADPRGTLTLKYVELANAIDQVRISQEEPPAILVWENVPGVLSDRANAFGCFLGALCGENRELQPPGERWTNAGCIYGPTRSVAWRVLDAQYFGVAQRRRRVFVVASARHDFDSAEVLFERDSMRRDSAPSSPAGESASSSPRSCAEGASQGADASTKTKGQRTLTACFGGNNTSGALDRAACLTGRGYRNDFEVETFAVQAIRGDVSHTLTASHDATEDGGGRGVPVVAVKYPQTQFAWPANFAPVTIAFAENSRSEVRLEGGNGHVIGALSKGGGKPGQGTPMVASLSLRGRQHGVAAELGDDLAPALRASSGGSDKVHVIYPSLEAHLQCTQAPPIGGAPSGWMPVWRVRRLMPLECERLQGMPDNYTLVPFRGQPAADAPRYKAIGESMAVPCVRWIGYRLLQALSRSLG